MAYIMNEERLHSQSNHKHRQRSPLPYPENRKEAYRDRKGEESFVRQVGDQYIRDPFDTLNETITHWSLEWFERNIGPYLPSTEALGVTPNKVGLCQQLSGDGKRRLFLIGN